ncbi:hypothetical protein A2721_01670 [Candidatus Gottesmanbacteria bacterium RIFCSPHIGHO2_01_FULL_47_48]|uniref:Ribbon-helix-helix protein CopG domain-containing protein n=1 Tax=Candidatus Gottesmanbacteria bacterium RIFCSPHIGHO2_01_FULL_47_48 TaxID=1798381 RepID=A0A1F6A2A8_9BACT|nr:MAG: hypothetical protein A2721_01670 [Candidatus Gottesmanbacteria bacterium RIFCSPHIGHO2_01_FULL_47_48]
MLNIRTNILFDQSMWKQLQNLAKSQNTSIGQLVRSAVKKTYSQDEIQRRRAAAIEKTFKIRPKLKNLDFEELINYGRER